LLFLSTIHASSNYEDGIFGEGSQDISSMRVFYATLIGLFVGGAISSVTEYYTGLGTKPVMAIVQKSSTGAGDVIAGLATGMISQLFYYLLQRYGLLMHWQVLWCSFSSISHDGNNGYAISNDAFNAGE
jgi:Na+/H+-translocating membrane pyrophosphatase